MSAYHKTELEKMPLGGDLGAVRERSKSPMNFENVSKKIRKYTNNNKLKIINVCFYVDRAGAVRVE